MQILAISDKVMELLYNAQAKERFGNVDIVLSCGDLPYFYIEYIVCNLDKPTYFVRGNHASKQELGEGNVSTGPEGATDLHRRTIRHSRDLLLSGIEGSLRYRPGPFQYSQSEMWLHVFRLLPGLFINRIFYGRYLDVLVTHAPPWGIHDEEDLPHQGVKAFLWLDRVFQPAYHLHGHTHLHHQIRRQETQLDKTRIVNVYGYQEIQLPAE
jgi:hypothetical protein